MEIRIEIINSGHPSVIVLSCSILHLDESENVLVVRRSCRSAIRYPVRPTFIYSLHMTLLDRAVIAIKGLNALIILMRSISTQYIISMFVNLIFFNLIKWLPY